MLLYKDKNWLYQKYIMEKLSTIEIQKIYGFPERTILRYLNKFNIKVRNRSEAGILRQSKIKAPYKNKDFLIQKYIKDKFSGIEIAKLCKCDFSIIYDWLRIFNIKIRNRSEARSKELHPNWGKHLSRKTKRKISKSEKGKKVSIETRKKQSIAKEGYIPWIKGKHHTKEAKKKIMEALLRTIKKRPTNPEKLFDEMTPDIIRYVGNRAWWRLLPNGKYKNPDFKITGQNKVIEIFGDYWHRGENPQD